MMKKRKKTAPKKPQLSRKKRPVVLVKEQKKAKVAKTIQLVVPEAAQMMSVTATVVTASVDTVSGSWVTVSLSMVSGSIDNGEVTIDSEIIAVSGSLAPEEEPKKAVKSVRMYFNQNTQAAIIAYQNAKDDKKERERLYVTEIMPAYEKLVENLINIHRFSSLHDSYDDLKNDCVNFLFETIGKFDGNRGTNAFSYFNVVAKNWLIIRTKQKAQRTKRNVSLDDPDALSAHELKIVEDKSTLPAQDVLLEKEHAARNIIKVLYEIRSKAKTENELACANSVITIFENIGNLDIVNKSSTLLYLRELSGLSPKQLTTSLQALRKHYRRFKLDPRFDLFG